MTSTKTTTINPSIPGSKAGSPKSGKLKLFNKFSTDKEKGGTGLGLFIAKNVIEAYGGKIWAENNEGGRGATFAFVLPLVQAT